MSDVYVVVDIATTCDESTSYITADSTELIEFSWAAIDASTLDMLHKETILVRPTNTPITPYCAKVNRILWEHVKSLGGTFKDAISKFDKYVQSEIFDKNLQFLFVSWDVSKLRVQLPREARDKLVVLPPYLQHPRVFDLQLEYVKWQLTHPEALSYTNSSLANVITALEVELTADERESSTRNAASSGLKSHTNADLSSSIGSLLLAAADDAAESQDSSSASGADSPLAETQSTSISSVLTKVLAQLVRKSMPVEEHPLVLTKPLDSAQDVRVFLSERSKILYLSNLPVDTTQSELDLWFTQYGGRPIAFWTLKLLDDNSKPNSAGTGSSSGGANAPNSPNTVAQASGATATGAKSISGFAVFATHEEATELLSMNGRLLSDRAIEVQASSTKVLDKASDLLSPFPPLKNRPRPGDWTCPSCGFSNFQRRTACFRCSFPAASAVAIQESIYSTGGPKKASTEKLPLNHSAGSINQYDGSFGYGNSGQSHNGAANLGYSSSNNSFNNTMNQQHGGHNNHNHVNQGQNGGQSNHGHGHQTQGGGNSRNYGNNVPFRAGDWKCEACFYHNFAKNLCCLKCGNNKPNNSTSNNNNNNNNNIYNTNSNNSNSNVNNMGYAVNSTAAAIAAATASGQPLNNGYMGMPQSQQNMYNNNSNNTSNNSNNKSMNKNLMNGGGKTGNSPNKQFAPQQYQKHLSKSNPNLRSNSTGSTPKPLLPQHLMMFQQQQQQQHQQQHQHQHQQQHEQLYTGQSQSPMYSQSVTNSPALYDVYSNHYNSDRTGNTSGVHSPSISSVDRLNGLSSHVQSLNLNN